MMEGHDRSLRRTPYELVFGPDRFEAEVFPAIEDEAAARGQLEAGAESFVMLGTVGRLLRELRPAASGREAGESGPPPEAVRQYGALVWHAWSFWRSGRIAYALSPGLARRFLTETAVTGDWTFRAPAVAGYVQLPRHLLWARVDDRSAAEPIDGLHWRRLDADASDGRPEPRLDLLLALGLRPGRGGLSVIEVSAALPETGGGHWCDIDARGNGNDFANILPGGEMQGYHGLVSAAEVLKLASRFFHWIDRRPDSIDAMAGAEDPEDAVEPRSRLAFRWVRNTESGAG